ncbi:hypothetical protein ACWGI0_30575 [Streptomyces sp. NPDC054802]
MDGATYPAALTRAALTFAAVVTLATTVAGTFATTVAGTFATILT